MDCNEVKINMDRYIEKNLNKIDEISLEKHLNQCNLCKGEFKDMEYVFSVLNEPITIKPPANFTDKIMNKINRNKSINLNKTRKIWGASLVAAGFLLFFINTFTTDVNVNSFSQNIYLNSIDINKKIVKPFGSISKYIDLSIERLNEEVIK